MGFIKKVFGVEDVGHEALPDEERDQRHARMIEGWKYVRSQLDRGLDEYSRTGERRLLEAHCDRQIMNALCAEVDQLKAQGLEWSFKTRRSRGAVKIEIIDEVLDKNGAPRRFTVRESFKDFSQLAAPDTGQLLEQGRGEDRVLSATIVVEGGKLYYVKEVNRIAIAG